MQDMTSAAQLHGTTIVCARRDGVVAMGGDGQLTYGEAVIGKATATKVRELLKGKVLAGMAGETGDCLTLLDRFRKQLDAKAGKLGLAVEEFAKSWNTDKMLRRFNAQLLVADREEIFLLMGNGTVVVPEHDVVAIGSGMGYALAAGRALLEHTEAGAEEIVTRSLGIAADICVYTNNRITLLKLT